MKICPPPRDTRLAMLIVSVAAGFVPRHLRVEWRREWKAELASLPRRDTAGRSRTTALRAVRLSLLCVPDALMLRVHDWNPELLVHEVRQTVRAAVRRPAASLFLAGVVALGVATAAVVFSLADGILRRPLPYPSPGEVVLVGPRWLDGRESSGHLAAAEYLEIVRRSEMLATVGAIDQVESTLLGDGAPVELPIARVTPSTFGALGVAPLLGRTFSDEEGGPEAAEVAVLSHRLWRDAFGADPSVLGREVLLDDGTYSIVGVMPAGFVLPTEVGRIDRSRLFLPLGLDPADPGPFFIKELEAVVARMAPGSDLPGAALEIERIAASIIADHPDNYRPDEWTLRVASPLEEAVAGARPTLRLLVAAVAFLVLAVCANLAGLVTSRAAERRTEVSVRTALGARRSQIVRRVGLEGVLLAGGGGILGVALAARTMPWIRATLQGSLPRTENVSVNLSVAAAAVTLAIATAGLFSVVPAVRATRADVRVANPAASRGSGRRGAFRRLLIGGQLAVAAVLLTATLLLVRSMASLSSVDPGFLPSGVRTIELSLPSARYSEAARVEAFYRRLLDDLEGAPGVEEVGLARRRPMADRYGTWTMAIRGADEPRRLDDDPPRWQVVTPGYFAALSIALESGRLFTEAEMSGPPGPVVVNRSFAEAYWPGRSPLDTEIRMDGGPDNPWLTVVGVIDDVRFEGPRTPANPVVYLPHPHFDEATSLGSQRTMHLVLRTSLDTEATRRLVESRLAALDPALPHGGARSLDEIVAEASAETRVLSKVFSLFALVTLLLGAVGVYGTLAHEVSARAREMGIRSALGAGRGSIIREVVQEGFGIAGAGIATGLAGALVLADWLAAYLFGIQPRDPLTFASVAGILVAVAAAASYLPARRAASTDPVVPLRVE